MKCTVCQNGELQEGTTTVTLEHDLTVAIFKGVPALVCEQCGESYTDEETTANLLRNIEEEARIGPREYFAHYLA